MKTFFQVVLSRIVAVVENVALQNFGNNAEEQNRSINL